MNKIRFLKIKEKLDIYAQVSNIQVVYKNFKNGNDAEWSFTKKIIYLNENVTDYNYEIANYLHELGHMRDDYTVSNKKWNKINKSYQKEFENKKLTLSNKKHIIETEYRAWINARAIAKQLNIKLGKWFNDIMDHAIYNYYHAFFPRKPLTKYEQDYKNGKLKIRW